MSTVSWWHATESTPGLLDSVSLALIAEHGGGVDDTAIAVETDKNLIVVALVEAGFTVYPINPRRGRALSGTLRTGRREV